jgi:beta-lactamase superfamily II metal-dependent hydrolase
VPRRLPFPIRPCAGPAAGVALAMAVLLVTALSLPALAVTPTGRLQVIHLDVGQGDGAVLISPLGEVAMIDNGPGGSGVSGQTVVQQLQALGITRIDHLFASHYHADHISATDDIANAGITIARGWDRGGSYTTQAYTNYVNTLGARRRTLVRNQVITLDSLSTHPVTITCVNLGGAGVYSGSEENCLSLVLKVSYGEFDAVFGGDLSGANSGSYRDIETTVGPQVGQVEEYKVHHHGALTSTNVAWLAAVQPKIAVISAGNGNSYGHPVAATLARLHDANVRTFWTETGNGVAPDPAWDHVASGKIVISATWEPAGVDSVRAGAYTTTLTNSGSPLDLLPPVVALLSPNGGESWDGGTTHDITWTATDNFGVTAVDLAYSTDGGLTWPLTIATGVANTGSYSWTLPADNNPQTRVRVTAHDAAGHASADASDGDFGILGWVSGVGDLALGDEASLGVFPNPSGAGATQVRYSAPRAATVDLAVYDLAGRLVRRLEADADASAEARTLRWDGRDDAGRDVPSGVYLVQLATSTGQWRTQRLVLCR